jgi:tripartite-type tricarboxylate transporter receptor subunit TctC
MPRLFLAVTTIATMLAVTSIVGGPAMAQETFPSRSIRVINPLPAGSAVDVIARMVGEQLTGLWHQPVVVENRPGAGGALAAQAVAGAPPDGYTLLVGAGTIFTILPAEQNKLTIDVNRDLVPLGLMGGGAMYIAVPPSLGVSSLPELIALAKSRPQEIVVGTNGAGSLPHFAALALAKMGNVPITIVPYSTGGTMAAISDIMGGRVHATIESMSALRGALQAGDLKLIAVMSPERAGIFPDLPTAAETIPGLSAVGFISLAAPAGTPGYIVRRLSEGLRHALQTSIVKQRLDEFDMQRPILTPEDTKAYIENEEKLWWPLVREIESK